MNRYHEMVMFQALSQRPSLAAAARRLNVSGPTVVRAVARLEERLGASLLQRSTQGVVLTKAGLEFMADCTRILKEIEVAEASAKGLHTEAQGSLTVVLPSLFSNYVITPLLAGYMDMYPDIKVFTQYQDRFPNMNEEGIDVAIQVGHMRNSSLIARPVGYVRSIVCGSPAYLETHGEPYLPDDVRGHKLVGTESSREGVQWDFLYKGEMNVIKVRSRLRCATVQAAINAAKHGAGLTRCLSYPLYGYLSTGQLQRILQPFELPALPVHVVYRERRKASIRLRSFVDFMVEGLRAHPAMRPDA